MVVTDKITIESSDKVPEIIDITPKIEEFVANSGVTSGQVLVYAQHTTAAVIIQEKEEKLYKDIENFICELCPKDKVYNHSVAPDHVKDGLPNGHSHLQHMVLGGSSETVPVLSGKMMLGMYQRIFLVELDRARTRNVVVQVVGE